MDDTEGLSVVDGRDVGRTFCAGKCDVPGPPLSPGCWTGPRGLQKVVDRVVGEVEHGYQGNVWDVSSRFDGETRLGSWTTMDPKGPDRVPTRVRGRGSVPERP